MYSHLGVTAASHPRAAGGGITYLDELQLHGTVVQCYHPDDISGSTWANEANASHDLTIVGASTETSGGPTSAMAKFLRFDGIDDYASTAHAAAIDRASGQSGAHIIWVRRTTNLSGSASNSCAFSKGSGGYEFRRAGSSGTSLSWDPSAASGPDVTLTVNVWTMVVCSVNNTVSNVYHRQVGSETWATSSGGASYATNTNPFVLGRRASASQRFLNIDIASYAFIPDVTLSAEADRDAIFDAAFNPA